MGAHTKRYISDGTFSKAEIPVGNVTLSSVAVNGVNTGLYTTPREERVWLNSPAPAGQPVDITWNQDVPPFDGFGSVGTKILEFLFNDTPGSATALNTGTLGGSWGIGGSLVPSIVGSGGQDGGGYLQFQNAGTSDNHGGLYLGWSAGLATALTIGTKNFEISVYAQFATLNTAWGQVFWGWSSGTLCPQLVCEDVTGKLMFSDGTTSAYTSFVCPVDTTWRKYTLRRKSGLLSVWVNNTNVLTMPYTANCSNGFNSGSFIIGTAGNTAAGQCGKFDDFRFFNENV